MAIEYKNDSDYTTRTNPGTTANNLESIGRMKEYRAASNVLHRVANEVQSATKLVFSELGFWKQVISYGGRATTPYDHSQNAEQSSWNNRVTQYETRVRSIDRQDVVNECVFRCGSYFLPLSFTYSVRASKQDAISQLVDGVEIIQRIAKKPKEVNVNIRLERNLERAQTNVGAERLSFIDNNSPTISGSPLYVQEEGAYYLGEDSSVEYSVATLASVLRDLYENNDVFVIENKTLTNDLGMEWVYMRDFEFSVSPGTTLVDISMTLREVNAEENAIVFNQKTINSDESAGGGARTVGE